MAKTKEMAPPTLIAPANMMPIFTAGAIPVEFNWTPVRGVRRLSTAYFPQSLFHLHRV